MMMETEINILNEKISYLHKKLKAKRQEANCLKSNIRMDHLTFLEDQMCLVQQYYFIVQDSMSKGDRITSVNHIQLIAEITLKMEAVFDGETLQEIEYQYGYEDDNEMDDEYEEDYE